MVLCADSEHSGLVAARRWATKGVGRAGKGRGMIGTGLCRHFVAILDGNVCNILPYIY